LRFDAQVFVKAVKPFLVGSPSGRKRSVYLVRIERLAEVLNSFKQNGVTLEHIFDF